MQVTVLHLSLYMYFSQQGVAATKLALQVLGTPKALELTIHHHCKPGAKGLTLFHASEGICREDGEMHRVQQWDKKDKNVRKSLLHGSNSNS